LDKIVKAQVVKCQVQFTQIISYTWSSPDSVLHSPDTQGWLLLKDLRRTARRSQQSQSIAAKGTGDCKHCPKHRSKTEVVEDASSHLISTTQG